MSGAKRYMHISPLCEAAPLLMANYPMATEYVLASDYDRDTQRLSDESHRNRVDLVDAVERSDHIKAERDELRAQVEAMRAALTPLVVDWVRCGLSVNNRLVAGSHPALDKIQALYAALQAKP